MPWVVCIKRSDTGKYQLVTNETHIDPDDPRFEPEAHNFPCKPDDIVDGLRFHTGPHDLTRACFCDPEIRDHIAGYDIEGFKVVIHREIAVN